MALDTYANLKLEIADWLNRSDLTTQIDTFIDLAEARMNREIRVRDMLSRTTLSISSQFTSLPSDFIAMRNINLDTSPLTVLQYVTPEYMDRIRRNKYSYSSTSITGMPVWYTIKGSEIEVVPNPDSAKTANITYYAKIPALTTEADTNWVLTNHPELYLTGTLVAASAFLVEDNRIPLWESGYQKGVEDLHRASDNYEIPRGGATRIRANVLGV